ncbi:aspartyl-phosphate phosphatase Spo0E family protein [Lentibacillus sp. N15]|uniref:aspartyl-phosphate phosphatase Spo0E family protein n=1 Tax=Lentibacillus songyuanensis TaxID=3136161 RepID=UPI0031BA40F5
MNTQKNLQQAINKKRQEMIGLAFNKGFTSKDTVKCSQELDQLLNLYSNVKLHKIA